jgi:hypothetical protein
MREREDLSGIREGHGSLAGGVEGVEKEDEERDKAEMSRVLYGDPEAEASCEKGPALVDVRSE